MIVITRNISKYHQSCFGLNYEGDKNKNLNLGSFATSEDAQSRAENCERPIKKKIKKKTIRTNLLPSFTALKRS